MAEQLYDVTGALAALAEFRRSDELLARGLVSLGDELADAMRRHFPDPADAITAGTALVIATGALKNIAGCESSRTVLAIAGLAGQRLTEGTPHEHT